MHAVQEKQPDQFGPLDGRAPANVVGHADGTTVVEWWTYSTRGKKIPTVEYTPYQSIKVNGMDQGRNHLMKLWHKLDECIDAIRGNPAYDMEHDKTRASTLAEVIAQLMHMFYSTPEDVLRESMARWQARQDGIEHQSPGLAEYLWDPARRFDGTAFSKASEAAVRAGRKPQGKKVELSQDKINFIKHTLSQSPPLMDAKALAGMFGCSEADIKEAYDS